MPVRGTPSTRFPFGGYEQSGNGREFGRYGLDFLEITSSQFKHT